MIKKKKQQKKKKTSRQMCNQLINNKIDLWEREGGRGRAGWRRRKLPPDFMSVCLCTVWMCLPACVYSSFGSKNIDLVLNLKKKSNRNPVVYKKNKMWHIGAGGSFPCAASLFMPESFPIITAVCVIWIVQCESTVSKKITSNSLLLFWQ